MSKVRAWQRVESSTTGRRIVSIVQIDLSEAKGVSSTKVRYIPFSSKNSFDPMVDFARIRSRFGTQAPDSRSILLISRANRDCHYQERYPRCPKVNFKGSTLISADSLEVAVLNTLVKSGAVVIKGKRLHLTDHTHEYSEIFQAILDRLNHERRILYYPKGVEDYRSKPIETPSVDLIIPFNCRVGYLSRNATEYKALVGINGGFFCDAEEDYIDPFTFANDPIGLIISRKKILAPPIYKRTMLGFGSQIFNNQIDNDNFSLNGMQVIMKSIGLINYALKFPGKIVLMGKEFHISSHEKRFAWNDCLFYETNYNFQEHENDFVFYNRLWSLKSRGSTTDKTPSSENRIEFIIAGQQICAVHEGGKTYIPRNGFVVSMPKSSTSQTILEHLWSRRETFVEQAIDLGHNQLINVEHAIHAGPKLISLGKNLVTDADTIWASEEYVAANGDEGEAGIPPAQMSSYSLVQKKLSRIGFGVSADNYCYIVLIEGCEARTSFELIDSEGGTLWDLSDILRDLGCIEAVALDGGGSSQIVFDGKSINRVSDRLDIPFTPSERLIPGGFFIVV